jgi:hypothetical protein
MSARQNDAATARSVRGLKGIGADKTMPQKGTKSTKEKKFRVQL